MPLIAKMVGGGRCRQEAEVAAPVVLVADPGAILLRLLGRQAISQVGVEEEAAAAPKVVVSAGREGQVPTELSLSTDTQQAPLLAALVQANGQPAEMIFTTILEMSGLERRALGKNSMWREM